MPSHSPRVTRQDFVRLAPKVSAALAALSAAAQDELDAPLIELLKLRSSQINGCAFCLQHHLGMARKAGVDPTKIDLLAAWREAGVFSEPEIAALRWTEELTARVHDGASDDAWVGLRAHFDEKQAIAICTVVSSINAWNRLAIGLRFAPESV